MSKFTAKGVVCFIVSQFEQSLQILITSHLCLDNYDMAKTYMKIEHDLGRRNITLSDELTKKIIPKRTMRNKVNYLHSVADNDLNQNLKALDQ